MQEGREGSARQAHGVGATANRCGIRRGMEVHARHGGHPGVAANRCSIRMQGWRGGSARQARGVRGGGKSTP
eukprot:999674-Pyramimonas_sp.AAC.1